MFPVPLGWLHRRRSGKAGRIWGQFPEIAASNAEPFGLPSLVQAHIELAGAQDAVEFKAACQHSKTCVMQGHSQTDKLQS
ncbi:hypothetical protein [Ochrobactrum sp. CGA5]|uniref:hypothetical protein n=1 Tax=Ochrobactrum sp. CGA5 TaxID=2583453 RepID=UPI00111F0BB8|nr:hypothetical protein [Ochrobactrum sp. CGA5]